MTQDELPYSNPFGMVYDSGAYHDVMEKALAARRLEGFRGAQGRRRASAESIAASVLRTTSTPRPAFRASAPRSRCIPTAASTSSSAPSPTARATRRASRNCCNEWLGVPIDKVRLITGDTDIVKVGGGTHSGRGMRLGSIVIWKASGAIIEKGKQVAALLLQASPEAVDFRGRPFRR